MKEYRVHVEMNNKKYGLYQIVYDDDRGQRFEILVDLDNSTIYPNEEMANLAIITHKRTRKDQIVQFYKLIRV